MFRLWAAWAFPGGLMFTGFAVNSSGEQSVRHPNKHCQSMGQGGSGPLPQPTQNSFIPFTSNVTKLRTLPHPKPERKREWCYLAGFKVRMTCLQMTLTWRLKKGQPLLLWIISQTLPQGCPQDPQPPGAPGWPHHCWGHSGPWASCCLHTSLPLPLIPALPAQRPGPPDSGEAGCLRQEAPPVNFTHESACERAHITVPQGSTPLCNSCEVGHAPPSTHLTPQTALAHQSSCKS